MIIREMQCKLATWATMDESRRFDHLMRLIAEPEWLQEAVRIRLASSGAQTPGVDGMTKTIVESRMLQLIKVIREQLLDGTYQPLPARRVYIPKSNGKMRPLGIPTLKVKDR